MKTVRTTNRRSVRQAIEHQSRGCRRVMSAGAPSACVLCLVSNRLCLHNSVVPGVKVEPPAIDKRRRIRRIDRLNDGIVGERRGRVHCHGGERQNCGNTRTCSGQRLRSRWPMPAPFVSSSALVQWPRVAKSVNKAAFPRPKTSLSRHVPADAHFRRWIFVVGATACGHEPSTGPVKPQSGGQDRNLGLT